MAKQRTRKVSEMSQQQLQHKRDLDRKAQRTLRERNKSRIQILEEELADMRATMSEQVNTMSASLLALRQENGRLNATLGGRGQLVPSGPTHIVPSPITSPIESTHEVQSGSDRLTDTVIIDPTNRRGSSLSPPRLVADIGHQQHRDQNFERREYRDFHIVLAESTGDISIGRASSPDVRSESGMRLHTSQDYLSPGHQETSPFTRESDKSPVHSLDHNSAKHPHTGHHANITSAKDDYLDGTAEAAQDDAETHTTVTPQSSTGTHISAFLNPLDSSLEAVWSFLPKHSPPTCPLDQILLDFLASRISMSTRGAAMESVLGPRKPSVLGLVTPSLAPTVHPVSRVMAEVLTTFPNVSITEKMGFMYKMHLTMRWQIEPTEENYLEMPRWLHPTATQLTTPHAAWIDNIPWPSVRDILIQKPDVYPFQVFSELYSQNVSVNWPYESDDAFLHVTSDGKVDAVLNPIFEKHIRKLSNWTVSRYFERQLSEMCSAIYSRD